MKYNSDKQRRCSIRLKDYDYSREGAYFVTICTKDKEYLFGSVADGQMRLNEYGHVVLECWGVIPEHFKKVVLDEFVVMPNHVHGILVIMDNYRDTTCRDTACRVPTREQFGKPTKGSLPTIMRSFKSAVTKRINEIRNTPGDLIWQGRYYEHVVRNENSLNRIRQYILNNPLRWDMDIENPDVKHKKSVKDYYDFTGEAEHE